jgi:urease gamma subunit
LRFSHPEAVVSFGAATLEGARDGNSVAELISADDSVPTLSKVMVAGTGSNIAIEQAGDCRP